MRIIIASKAAEQRRQEEAQGQRMQARDERQGIIQYRRCELCGVVFESKRKSTEPPERLCREHDIRMDKALDHVAAIHLDGNPNATRLRGGAAPPRR